MPLRLPAGTGNGPSQRTAWFGGREGSRDVPVIGRADLDHTPRSGPLLVDEYDATTLVPPRASARLDVHDNIVISTMELR